jgi:hypothetical protein
MGVRRVRAAKTAGVPEARANVRARVLAKAEPARVSRVRERRKDAVKGAKMFTRIAGTVILSVIVFVVITLLVGLGLLKWTGGVYSSAVIGVICGLAAAFTISAVSTAVGRSGDRRGERLSHENERSGPPPDHLAR